MKKIKSIAFLATLTLTLSSYTTINNVEEIAPIFSGCGSGQTEVSWSVTCPNGNTYSGSRCFKKAHALEAAEAIANAPCPN